ncbi:uncharacterized protein LOC114939804 [Nylanderia fulva]|uniref:uncharacterized protein LOC114939804 n=1 Tax=Nylanderia fulva TaxID=613905 RepID=UPI0010FB5436|nr:uncharacterized protein LOC114939804 [Nylanderia fulva]
MSNLRRRANDFTNSLKSFHQTICEEKQNSIVSQRNLEDTLDNNSIKRQCESDIHNYQRNNESHASIIIAGRLDNQQYISSAKYRNVEDNDNQFPLRDISDETSYLSLKFDLNKGAIFQDEQLSKENHTCEEYSNYNSTLSKIKVNKDIDPHYLNKNKNIEVQCNLIKDCPYAMSSNSLEGISKKNQDVTKEFQRSKSCSMLNSNMKTDTNHNIKASYFSATSTNTPTRKSSYEKTDITALFDALTLSSKTSLSSNKKIDFHSTEEDQQCNSTNSKTSLKEQLNFPELKAFLDSLEYQKPLKETAVQERMLRRLSANFYHSPKTFTERLLTIIEESVMSNDSCAHLEYPEASLCRLSEEIRKMCKFIDDETVPEWPQSPSMSKSICKRQSIKFKSPSRKSLNASRSKGIITPPSPRCKSPKKICQRMSKNTSYNIKGSVLDNTSTFESLEAFCEKFYANENKAVPREKNPLQSPLQNINNILRVCENQMASLEDTLDIQEQLRKAQTLTPDLTRQHNEVSEEQTLRYRLLTQEKRNKTDSKEVPNIFKQWAGSNKSYEIMELDDLENTLMYEIAKKRQRCLDTAKVMMEIDTNSESEKVQQIYPKIVITESSPTRDAKFMETLMSVKRYQEYLEEHKSILNLFQTGSCNTSRISLTPNQKYIRTKEITREDVGTRRLGEKTKSATLKVSTMKKKSTSSLSPKCSTNNMVVSKPKLFVTPGKTPTKKSCKPKRSYFPDLVGGMNKEKKPSPHLKTIYQQLENYDYVVSPVGMYIKGTDPHLIKNLRSKTNEKLLTPREKQIKRSLSPKLKAQLSPKLPKKTMTRIVGDENIPDNFLHPKVHYKLPSHIRTIKETENRKVGNRINELLRSTQDKVVVRHKGRIKSVQTECSKQLEIHYDSAEESVHVEQTAYKTCFSRVQKD